MVVNGFRAGRRRQSADYKLLRQIATFLHAAARCSVFAAVSSANHLHCTLHSPLAALAAPRTLHHTRL